MADAEQRNVSAPDEVRSFENGEMGIVRIGGGTVGRATFQPGWRWSDHVKPIAGTESCEAPHFGYMISGRMGIRMNDGHEFICEPGDVVTIPPGHDGWVEGNEPVVFLDWGGATNYAKG